jgi:hypothetical protein
VAYGSADQGGENKVLVVYAFSDDQDQHTMNLGCKTLLWLPENDDERVD